MALGNTKRDVKLSSARSFLNRDRDAFRASLLQYARVFFPDRIKDLSDASLGGMFLEFAAEVGDNMSFYLDHQFSELDPNLAVESQNIQRHILTAGVPITGASPAVVAVTWAIEVPALQQGSQFVPSPSTLPVVMQGSTADSDDGITFELTEDLDFSSRDHEGVLRATVNVGQSNPDGSPATFILSLGGPGKTPEGLCISGLRSVESFSIPNVFQAFREISLGNRDVTQVVSVDDLDGNRYYEVGSLTQDTVFRGIPNLSDDDDLVAENLEVIPAPFRFVTRTDFDTKLTTLRFGSGNAITLNDDIIPDPGELAVPLYGRTTFSRFTLDPGQLLNTQTLGVSPVNTTLSVTYRFGGGLLHNVAARSISTISTLRMTFPGNPAGSLASQVRASLAITNVRAAAGGEDPPTLDELRDKIPAARNAQGRIVTKADLLARVYTMPSNFGRVFRAGVRSNPRNPLATQLFIISRDIDGRLTVSPDTLKKNLRVFLNEFRMISDAIDILDSPIINFGVEFRVTTELDAVKSLVVQDIITRLKRYFQISNFQIDQHIPIDDVRNIIFNNPGVASLTDVRFKGLSGQVLDRMYSDVKFDVNASIRKNLIIGPPGSIFEMRYPDFDIIGSAQ